jgi:hypothetical protein
MAGRTLKRETRTELALSDPCHFAHREAWAPVPRHVLGAQAGPCGQGQTRYGGVRACPCTMAPAASPRSTGA